eukprot:gene4939-6156_t
MPIIYSLVARESTVLAEFTNTSGNFVTITRRILNLIPPNDTKMSYVYEKYELNPPPLTNTSLFTTAILDVHDSITYLCMADEEFGRRIPFAFLEDVKNRFRSIYGDKGKTALAYGLNSDFSRTLENLMDYYSNNPRADQLNKTIAEVDEVKNILVSDIADKLLKRGEKIEILVDRTDNLNQQSFKFKKQSKQLKCAMWWKNLKLMIIICIVVALIIFFIIAMSCGGFSFPNCRHKSKKPDSSSSSSSKQ